MFWFALLLLVVTVCFWKNFQRRKNAKWQNVKLCYQSLKIKKCDNKLPYFWHSFFKLIIRQEFEHFSHRNFRIILTGQTRWSFNSATICSLTEKLMNAKEIDFLPKILFCCISFFIIFQFFPVEMLSVELDDIGILQELQF